MPVLKQQNATPKLKDAIVLDLGDINRQAEQIRQQAREQADQIIKEAEQRAQQLVDGAEQKGHDQGYQAGYDKGYEAGREQGRTEALEQMQQQLQQVTSAWAAAANQWEQQRQQVEREAQAELTRFAVRLGTKLVHRIVEVDHTVIADQLSAALGHVLRPLDVTVCIHPDDRPLLEEAMPELTRRFNHLKHLELVDDPSIGRGGCIVRFGQGEIDATIDTQIDRIVRAMLPDDVAPHRPTGSAAPIAEEQSGAAPAAHDALHAEATADAEANDAPDAQADGTTDAHAATGSDAAAEEASTPTSDAADDANTDHQPGQS